MTILTNLKGFSIDLSCFLGFGLLVYFDFIFRKFLKVVLRTELDRKSGRISTNILFSVLS